jgi:hypothetical protein
VLDDFAVLNPEEIVENRLIAGELAFRERQREVALSMT